IPTLGKRQRKLLKPQAMAPALMAPDATNQNAGSAGDAALVASNNPLHAFHETLRDRLIGYFENKGLTHKPKLVAVTGLTHASGVTTTAAGLASSLSDTGDGNVLLVDLTPGQGAAQQFYRGKAVCGID